MILLLPAVAAGAITLAALGQPAGLWLRNPVAWAAGSLLAWALSRLRMPVWIPLVLAPLILAATFADRGQLGVHRWLALGPLRWNAAFLVLPSACVSIGVLADRARWVWWVAAACGVLLAVQPDASQATALAASMVVIAIRTGAGLVPIAGSVVLAGAAWFRPDPLAPVPEVEGIVGLAWGISPLLAVVAVAALAVASAAPLLAPNRTPALALSAYLATVSLMTLAGAFPVPLVGAGLSPVLGFLLAAGVYAAAIPTRTSGGR